MIRGLIAIFLTLMVLVMSLCFITRCTADVICAPVPNDIQVEAMAGRPNWKKFERKQKERRKQEDKRKKEDKRERDDDDIGRPRFILERHTIREAL